MAGVAHSRGAVCPLGQCELSCGPGLPVLAYIWALGPAHASWLAPLDEAPRHGFALKAMPRLTPTMPNAAFAGYLPPHCGYEMS